MAYRVSATRAVREFSELLHRTGDDWEEVLIERHSKPVVRMSPAGWSPVRWIDFTRQMRRNRSADSGFAADLLVTRGRKMPRPGVSGRLLEPGTVLLDSFLLVDAKRSYQFLPNLQRVATTSAAIAELTSLLFTRGEYIGGVRLEYLRRLAAALPVVSLDQTAALSVTAAVPGERGGGVFDSLAIATARSLDWPLVSYWPIPASGAGATGARATGAPRNQAG